jgi:predicted DNA-binding protein
MNDEVLTLRLPKGSRIRLTRLAKRKRQNLSQYVRDAIDAKLWIDALDETSSLAAPRAAALGIQTEDDVFKLFS